MRKFINNFIAVLEENKTTLYFTILSMGIMCMLLDLTKICLEILKKL